MNALFKNLQQDKIIFFSSLITVSLIVLNVLMIALFYKNLPPYIPLYNQMPWGEARIGAKIEIFIIPGLILIITIVNFLFSKNYYQKIPLISRLLAVTSFLISFLGFVLVLRIIKIII